jgi:hypothetical protein
MGYLLPAVGKHPSGFQDLRPNCRDLRYSSNPDVSHFAAYSPYSTLAAGSCRQCPDLTDRFTGVGLAHRG